jgi:hypothetical protein
MAKQKSLAKLASRPTSNLERVRASLSAFLTLVATVGTTYAFIFISESPRVLTMERAVPWGSGFKDRYRSHIRVISGSQV